MRGDSGAEAAEMAWRLAWSVATFPRMRSEVQRRGAGEMCMRARMKRFTAVFLGILSMGQGLLCGAADPRTVFVEAESLAEHGGWTLDTQFVHIMGSPYLIAHGMGQPVKDAAGSVKLSEAGNYRVWVRTKDWVAPWDAPGAPGRFELVLNGQSAGEFGARGKDWAWQAAGAPVQLPAGDCRIALKDLTGFNGRCDAVILSSDPLFVPPDGAALNAARKAWNGNAAGPEDAGEFDLVVCGGGYSGMGAAIAAARQSLKVALIQDRFVLGGNGSSEIRVWANGGTMRGKYPHIGEIIEEFGDHAKDSPGTGEEYGDALKEQVCRAEKTLTLFLGHFVHEAQTDPGTKAIRSVTALDVRTGRERTFRGKLFADCTGHGVLAPLTGAAFRTEPKGRMGMSNMWYWQEESTPQPWPETPWALALEPADFPKQQKSRGVVDGKPYMKAEWFWESGFDKDPINDLELIRDWNLRASYGAFSALKHGPEKEKHANASLKWLAVIGGTRESRLLDGDVILTRKHIVSAEQFPDGCVATTWDIDLHYPKEQYAKKFPDNPFISRAEFGAGVDRKVGYPVPYRCFYSKNVPNLFMAGRCISVDHEALGTVRVMRTCGMMGEVVGKAAYVCVKQQTDPRGVYANYWPMLQELLEKPGAMRRASLDSALEAIPGAPAVRAYLNKGQDMAGAGGEAPDGIPAETMEGIVIDDAKAEREGDWTSGKNLKPYIGAGYLYHAGPGASVRFPFTVPQGGKCEVRLAWQPHENRSSKTTVIIEREGQPAVKVKVNQKQKSEDAKGFHSLGSWEFPASGKSAVILSTEGADGTVHADAVQILPKR